MREKGLIDDKDRQTPSYCAYGIVSGRVVDYAFHKRRGRLVNDGYLYYFRVSSKNIKLASALHYQIKKDRLISLRFWPVVPFPELLCRGVVLKTFHFSEQKDKNSVKVYGIVHQSEIGKCTIRVPSLQMMKNYYCSVVTEEIFEPGVCLKIYGFLDKGNIVTKTIEEVPLLASCGLLPEC